MLEALTGIFNVLTQIPKLFLDALDVIVNSVMAAFAVTVETAMEVLPELPETLGPPEFVETLNWFVPLGAIVPVGVTMAAGYITWMAVVWLLRKFGVVS